MANTKKYPFVDMKIGDFHRLHFSKKSQACRAQAVAHVTARNKDFVLQTKVINFMLEVLRVS